MLPGYETVLLDDGANVMLIVSKKMLEAAQAQSWTSQAAIASVVKGPKLRLEGEASITMYPLCAGGAHGLMQLQGHKASGARRNIVPPQLLEKSLGATINYHATKYGPPSYDVAFPSGEEWLVLEYNDLFFAFVKVGCDPVLPRNLLNTNIGAETEINEAEINSAGMLCSLDPRIWAARLVTGADGVKAIKKAVRGMETMRVLTASDIHVIEHDRHRLAQTAKRKPTNATRDPKERIFTPGARFVIDVKTYAGKDQVTQIADRTGVKAPTCCIMAIDDSDSNYVYSFNSDTHTTEVLVIDAPIGTRIKVFWQGIKGQPELDKWYEGTIVSISTLANGQLRHVVKYDGWGDIEHVHDLVNGGKPWMRLGEDGWTFATVGGVTTASTAIESTSLLIPVGGDEFSEPLPAPTVPPSTPTTEQWVTVGRKHKSAVKAADAPEQLTRRSTRVTFAPSAPPAKTQARTTRHSGGAVSVAELTSSALERTQATPGMAQIIVEHLMGDEAPAFIKGDTVETILERVADVPFRPDHLVPADVIALEASGTQIEYVTEAGTKAVKDQPKGYAQVMASPDRDEWLEASRQSFVGLKNVRGNKMRRIEEATVEGPIFDVVSVYKIKLDPSTNKLDRVTVRHNVDGNRGKRVLAKLGIAYAVPTSSTTLDEVAFKMIISDSAKRQRFLTKADVKSAYTNAATSRGKRFLRCPDTAPEFDEDGTELVLELGPPLFGEPEAGYEWQMTLEKDLTELGWTPFENVPCMWRFETKDNDCILGTIVDDLLFSEATGHGLADASIEALRKKYVGVTSEHNPTAFAGYKIEQSPERDVITISLPELIEQKFKMECPELVPAEARAKFKLEHTKGSKLQKLADALERVKVFHAPSDDPNFGKSCPHCEPDGCASVPAAAAALIGLTLRRRERKTPVPAMASI